DSRARPARLDLLRPQPDRVRPLAQSLGGSDAGAARFSPVLGIRRRSGVRGPGRRRVLGLAEGAGPPRQVTMAAATSLRPRISIPDRAPLSAPQKAPLAVELGAGYGPARWSLRRRGLPP